MEPDDKLQRLENEGLDIARDRAISRRANVALHKYQKSPQSMIVVNESNAELGPYMYDKRAILSTNEGSMYVAKMHREFKKIVNVADEIIPGITPGLPSLPGGTNWDLYRIPDFMESGKLLRLVIKARYPTGKFLNTMLFLLSKRHPVNDPHFTMDDVILNKKLNLKPEFTGSGWGGEYSTWLDEDLTTLFNYDFPKLQDQSTPGGNLRTLGDITSLYVLTEQWRLPGPPPMDELRIELTVEDRGR